MIIKARGFQLCGFNVCHVFMYRWPWLAKKGQWLFHVGAEYDKHNQQNFYTVVLLGLVSSFAVPATAQQIEAIEALTK